MKGKLIPKDCRVTAPTAALMLANLATQEWCRCIAVVYIHILLGQPKPGNLSKLLSFASFANSCKAFPVSSSVSIDALTAWPPLHQSDKPTP